MTPQKFWVCFLVKKKERIQGVRRIQWKSRFVQNMSWYTEKNQILLIYKEIQSGAVAKSYMSIEEGPPNIWGYAQIFPYIWGGRQSYMTLQLLHSEFPHIWGKFYFLFISVQYSPLLGERIKETHDNLTSQSQKQFSENKCKCLASINVHESGKVVIQKLCTFLTVVIKENGID